MTDRLKYPNPFAMGNIDDLMVAWLEDDVEYLKEWSDKAIKEHERTQHIQMKAFKRLIEIKNGSSKSVEEIRQMLKESRSSDKTQDPVWKYRCEECGDWCETSQEMREHYMNSHSYSPVDATLVTRTSYTKYQDSESLPSSEDTAEVE